MEPATGQLIRQMAPTLHFWQLVSNRAGSEAYGITSEAPEIQAPAQLVRIDIQSGNVLEARLLDSGYWSVAAAPLRVIPPGGASVTLAVDDQ